MEIAATGSYLRLGLGRTRITIALCGALVNRPGKSDHRSPGDPWGNVGTVGSDGKQTSRPVPAVFRRPGRADTVERRC